jgi:hypothetical protein
MPLRTRVVLLSVIAVLGAPAVASAAAGHDPETDAKLGATDNAGVYLGGQSSTSQYHGCTRSDTQWFPRSLVSGQQTTTPSTHEYVTFTVNPSAFPTFTWQAKPGYKICGVEAFAALAGPTTKGGQVLTWVGYTSGRTSGTTDAAGKETIKVRMPKDLDSDLSDFAGQTLGLYGFQAVTVYVRKG